MFKADMVDQTHRPLHARLAQTTLLDLIKVNLIQSQLFHSSHIYSSFLHILHTLTPPPYIPSRFLPLAMGNAVVTPCFHQKSSLLLLSSSSSSSSSSKIIFWDGTIRSIKGKHIASEIMSEFPDKVVCHANSFFIGHPIPALALEDELMPGEAYFVLPINSFTCKTLSLSSILSLGSHPNKIKFGECSFEYLKDSNGRVLIKVMPEFITRLIHRDKRPIASCSNNNYNFLCSTPELKKHYQMLVKPKDQVWSPKLETILEYKVRFPPCRILRLDRKEREKKEVVSSR
ncbi:hypothetical protein VNO78_27407 [Psophocarpus tetragonolobus]|uniref:DUF4228 domain protein n=1 Tax=Psophocarpus tetragonolobus TaxID=3891 RepID=A0AAN9XC86_PSOTE